jgi:hypothetical protein
MKTTDLSAVALLAGVLGASIAACSAQSSGTPPKGGDGTSGSGVTIGNGNSGNVNPAGGSGTIGAGGTGTVGSSGSTGVAGTTTIIGTAGTTGTTGTAGATGTGGSSGMSCGTLQPNASVAGCCVATGTAMDLAIDDLEDLDNTILPIGSRQGYWYSYKDSSAATTLSPSATPFTIAMGGGHPCSLTPVPPACAGVPMGVAGSAEIKGSVNLATATVPAYAGMGFDFNNHFMKSCPYGASAYHGISFWAKGSPFKASVKIPATTGATAQSVGSCTAMCEDHYSQLIAPAPDGSWTQVTITFADSTKFKQAGWGTPATFDPGNILAVQFQIDGTTTQTAPATYDFAVDDLAFIP